MTSSFPGGFDPARSAAWRDLLIAHVGATRTRHRRTATAVFAVAGAVAGAGFSAAAFAATGVLGTPGYPQAPTAIATPTYAPAVDAPAGVIPGRPLVALLDTPRALDVTAATEVPLDGRPPAATHVRVTAIPRTAGTLAWGTDPGGNHASAAWTDADIAAGNAMVWADEPLDADQHTLFLVPTGGAEALVTVQYVVHVPTRLGVNADGFTYGAEGPAGVPDLIAVQGVGPDGRPVDGYAWRADLDADAPGRAGPPASPEEALRWQAERERDHPDGWDVPVYDSDGETRIGVLRIG